MEVGRQLKRLGVHINFAPVIDVNNNSANPVINFRAFGEDRYNVARKGLAYMQGLQDAGIIACAKHFPGHGDTDADSHYTLPLLKHSIQEIDSVHLYPFRYLIDRGLQSVMVAHLQIPSLEPTTNLASTLSHNVVTGLLQTQLGFEGLIITDALDMKGVSDFFKPGELELRALMAGNDILLLPEDVPAAIRTIKKAVEDGTLAESFLNEKVRKVLFFKQMAGLDKWQPIPTDGLHAFLNNPRARQLNKTLVQSAITLVRNENDLVPVTGLANRRIAALAIGGEKGNPFQAMLSNYGRVDHFAIGKDHSPGQASRVLQELAAYDLVIVSVHNNSMFVSRRYGITPETINLIKTLAARQQTILNLFANPYSLDYFGREILNVDAVVIAYQDGLLFEEAAAQLIFGGLPARGRLPVTVSPYFPAYKSIPTPERFRVRFATPEEVGVNGHMLQRIDSIVADAIDRKAFPGCQIAVVRDGAVIYHKAFGYHTYDGQVPVKTTDIYDLASVTKIAATTASVMRLTDERKMDLEQNIGFYLPALKGSDKEKITMRDMLAHQGRLRSWIPFYLETVEKGQPHPAIYSTDFSDEFPYEVAHNLFMSANYRDTIFSRIVTSPLLNRKMYRYSDLGFIMLSDMIERQSGLPIDQFAHDTFFAPLGLQTMTYRPLDKFPRERIVPSEIDTVFRRQILLGHVNDPAAAMLGGVAGHAGLFSNALDLAVLMQMFLQGGEYGGTRFINESTLREFTKVQFAGNQNRRALGFDKPAITPAEGSPASKSASPLSFGHSGFTGTYTWVDPQEDLVYVFLSNRTFPDPNNRKISELSVRTNIHQVIYDAIYYQRYVESARLP
jgi:beta-N-acetylhexosaminidase